MLAEIVPLRRLPKAFDTFTYLIPPQIESKIQVGQLVQIPFRNSLVLGVVFSLTKNSPEKNLSKLKSISDILFDAPFLSESFLLFLQKIGRMYGVALSTLFESALPELTTRTVKSLSVPLIENKKNILELPLYKKYSDEVEHRQHILDSIHGQTIIFVPEKQYLQTLFDFFPPELQKQTVLWHGELTAKQKRISWNEIRNSEKKIILATRSGVFLPLFQIETIILDYEHQKEYKNADQAPRFGIKDLLPLISEYSGAVQIHMSFIPSVESYFGLYKNEYQNPEPEKTLNFEATPIKSLPRIIDMRNERKGGNMSPLCEELEQKILAMSGDILLCINRKGAGSVMICKDCRFEEKCPSCDVPFVYHAEKKLLMCHYCKTQKEVPLTCKKCGSVVLEFKGVGTESIEKRVREILKGKNILIVRIEGDGNVEITPSKQNQPRVIIGTEKAFEYAEWNTVSLVAMLDLDRQLALPEFKTMESVWNLLQEIQYSRNPSSEFLIQTWDTKQLILKSLSEPDRFYRTNLNSRRALGYPPYRFLVRYFYGAVNQEIALSEAKKVCFDIEKFLTKTQKKATLTGPIELTPKYSRGRFWYGIIVKIEKKNWYEQLCEINALIPAGWKIDPNPNTLLHP